MKFTVTCFRCAWSYSTNGSATAAGKVLMREAHRHAGTNKHRRSNRTCLICKVPIHEDARADILFCSQACKSKDYRERQKLLVERL